MSSPTVLQATWRAFDPVYGLQIATNTLTVEVALEDVENPNDLLAPGRTLYTQLLADALADPTVTAYVNPIPSTTLYPAEVAGLTVAQGYVNSQQVQIYFYVTRFNGQ